MKPFGLYVHIPFCTVKCGYCDFNAYAGMDALKGAYTDALVREVEFAGETLAGRDVTSVAFGGGTPGEMPANDIARVLGAVRAAWSIVPGAEVSLEANPGTIDFGGLKLLREAGVTRLSLGAQSFDVEELRFLDRIHSPEATAASVDLARRAGFESVGLDLIYGLPGQPLASWERTVERAIALDPDHVSTYGLTVEEGTPLARRVDRGEIEPLDDDAVAEMYDLATSLLRAAGFHQYELSNWAKPGHESRHNLTYWTDGDYAGIGAGAHGYLDGERYENIAHPRAYIAAVASAGGRWPARAHAYTPTPVDAVSDFVALRLRLREGIDEADVRTKFGRGLDEIAGPVIEHCLAAGVIERSVGRLRLTERGRLLHGEVAAELLAHLHEGQKASSGAR